MTQINVKEKPPMDTMETQIVKRQSRWAYVAACVLLVSALVIGATFVGVFVGRNMTKETYEEAWATYHNTATGDVIKQRYILDGSEVLIVKPGEMSLIHDYDKGHAVIQFEDERYTSNNDCLCLVYEFDTSEKMSLDDLVKYLSSKNIQESGNFDINKNKLEITDQTLDLTNLSKRSQEMCHGCEIQEALMTQMSDGTGRKREKRKKLYDMCWFNGNQFECV